jgi:hypothetical protein
LETLAEHMARKWLGTKQPTQVPSAFIALVGYFNKVRCLTRSFLLLWRHIEHATHPTVERLPRTLILVSDIPVETIYSIAAWAADQVDTQILADTGKVNLAFVLRDAKWYNEALEHFEEAKSLRNNKVVC